MSFYKDLGAITGSCLLGESDVIAEAREWRHRHGGTLFGMWPYAASCLAALRTRWPRMPAYRAHALAVADALKDLDGARVVPDPPHTSLFHIHLRVTEAALTSGVQRIAEQQRIWTWKASAATAHPEWRVVELTVGDGTLGFTPDEVRALIAELVRDL